MTEGKLESSRCVKGSTMTPDDLAYFRARATAEREAASVTTGPAAEIHLKLASLYEQLVELQESPRRTLTIATSNRLSA